MAPNNPQKRLERVRQGRMVGGVCAGIAQYLGSDVTVVRVIALCIGLFTGVGPFVYLAAWLIMPQQGSDISGLGSLVNQTQQWNAPQGAQRSQQRPPQPETFDLYRDQH